MLKKTNPAFRALLGTLFSLFIQAATPLPMACAQASLAQGDTETLVVTYTNSHGENKTEAFTVMRDARDRTQWYYVPNAPRLTELTIDNVVNPEITLLRFQFIDSSAPGGTRDGGILTFSVTLSAETGAINAIKEAINQKNGQISSIKLTELPIKSAEAFVYSPADNLLVSRSFGAGIAPTFGTQKVPFSIYLTREGADVNAALVGSSVDSNTGIPVAIVITYQALTPPATLQVTANYRKIFDAYSSDRAFAGRVSYYGLFGASTQMRWTDIQEKLKASGALSVEKISTEEISEDNLNAIMPSVMKRINDNIFQTLSPPTNIAPASAAMPSVSDRVRDRWGSVAYNATFMKRELTSELNETFTWSERRLIERKTLVGGFVGIGRYPKEVRERAVTFVPGFNWDTAYAMLPEIGEGSLLESVIIQTELHNSSAKNSFVKSDQATWTPGNGWRDKTGQPVQNLKFSIKNLLENKVPASVLKFKTTTTVVQASRTTTVYSPIKDAVQEGFPVATVGDGFTWVTLDPIGLVFNNLEPTSKLLTVSATVTVGNREFSTEIQPSVANGIYTRPKKVMWLITREDAQSQRIKVELTYYYIDGSKIPPKTVVIENLRDIDKSLRYVLSNPALDVQR